MTSNPTKVAKTNMVNATIKASISHLLQWFCPKQRFQDRAIFAATDARPDPLSNHSFTDDFVGKIKFSGGILPLSVRCRTKLVMLLATIWLA